MLLKGLNAYMGGAFSKTDLALCGGRISDASAAGTGISVFNFDGAFAFPGFTDVHVHLREPGFSYKETIATGSLSAARGGYTAVGAMPNLSPVPDSLSTLREQTDIIKKDAVIDVRPYGTITKGQNGTELSDMEALAPYVLAFSDDGRGVQDGGIMGAAMERAHSLGKIIAAHCEDNSLVGGGYVHDGDFARKNGMRGISSESEWRQIERDLRLSAETGCAYHVCHISTKESVELIRDAKKSGVDVTCETAPHYLLLDDSLIMDDGRFKMNPPIRGAADRQALLEGLADGTIDMIATDHAPHAPWEKAGGLEKSLGGIVGLETAFPMLYTALVRRGVISMERLIELLHGAPARRFGLGTPLEYGQRATLTVFDLENEYRIEPEDFKSKGRYTPFGGYYVFGKCLMTVYNGRVVWKDRGVREEL